VLRRSFGRSTVGVPSLSTGLPRAAAFAVLLLDLERGEVLVVLGAKFSSLGFVLAEFGCSAFLLCSAVADDCGAIQRPSGGLSGRFRLTLTVCCGRFAPFRSAAPVMELR